MKRPSFKLKRKNPKSIDDLLKNTLSLATKKVYVGLPDDVNHTKANMSMKELAAIHEFGSIKAKIPKRPFINPSMNLNRGKYRLMMAKAAPKLLIRKTSIDKVLSEVGEVAKTDMKKYIKTATFTPLSPVTIKKKGHSRPLIETYQMYNAIGYKVDK